MTRGILIVGSGLGHDTFIVDAFTGEDIPEKVKSIDLRIEAYKWPAAKLTYYTNDPDEPLATFEAEAALGEYDPRTGLRVTLIGRSIEVCPESLKRVAAVLDAMATGAN